MTWKPLLEGELAARTMQAVKDVARALGRYERPAGEPHFPSLGGGTAGEALLPAYLALHGGDEEPAERAANLLDTATEAVATTVLPPGLYSGFPGIAWVAEHFYKVGFFEAEPGGEDPHLDIDQALLDYLGSLRGPDEYDLIRGLTGIGAYARERLPAASGAALLEQVIDRLARQAEHGPGGTTWFTPPERLPEWQREIHPRGLYNLGVAHGIPAVAPLLAVACRHGIAVDRARPLLDGTVRWLLAHRLPEGKGSCFGSAFVPGEETASSRLAWCYGDPGLAAALAVAAREVGETDWEAQALEIARRAARRPLEQSAVRDAGICHGAGGLAHLFNRFWQATGEEVFREAARSWIEHTLEFRQTPDEGIAGFLAWRSLPGGEGHWAADAGFLEGATGIALVLLAAVSPVEPQWDRMLLVS